MWRLLTCKVQMQGTHPDAEYIRVRGYLSLIKYLAYINSPSYYFRSEWPLLLYLPYPRLPPIGYADDIASASTRKSKIDRILEIVYKHIRMSRYDFMHMQKGL